MKFIIGKKIDMTQIWKGDTFVAVTRIEAGPCKVVQVKTNDTDGYEAVQLGFGTRKPKNINKAQKGHFKDMGNFMTTREFRLNGKKDNELSSLKAGDTISVDTFQTGDKIKVVGKSKGKGFQGVVKRHGFHGQDKTHGNKDQLRMPGSIGSTGPQHVFKGVKMAGRMGDEKVTTANLQVVDMDKENNILFIKGSVPGARNSLVMILGEGELIVSTPSDAKDTPIETNEEAVPETIEQPTETAEEKTDAIEEAKVENQDNKNQE